MGGSTYNARATDITREYYNILLATNPNAVRAVRRTNGSHVYYTYQLVQYF